MDFGERTTGTRDEHYNLISVLYHALHGAENCDRYASDAEVAGDERLAGFFRETQAMHTQVAERAKGLLGILEPVPEFEVTPDTISGGAQPPTLGYPSNNVPPTTDAARGTPGDVQRRTSPDTPIAPPEELVPPDVPSPPASEEGPPREEEPPPGEERPGKHTLP
jgi:hypothetical protein